MSEEPNVETEITQDDRLWATLSYIFSPVVPIVLLFLAKKRTRPFIKAHLAQALVFGTLAWLVIAILQRGLIERLVGLAIFVLVIIWGMAASRGERVTIPVITDFVKKMKWA
ncbi:MAG TPA: hypothetical protein PKL82_05760 [Anaerolineaceae bacterium]|jgi:uncharacterized membrane protein|nr:DUF4870 domain-containing protein [Anaerolineaceae bacterium]HOA21977.1 hypothetical protein [Anaerolineaceae bacterium]HOG77486.1 hypothetical protein [Anaerolineaceae bacterium]